MRLHLRNFMSHDDSIVELPATGVVLVTGPNGAGKSAITESIATALWGKTLRGARWTPWRIQPGWVELIDGSMAVKRLWNGKSKSLRWSNEIDRSSTTIKHDTTSKAQEELDGLVGSFDVWRRTSVFSAADAAHFTMASDLEDRKSVV